MHSDNLIFNLGPVRASREHDYRQFFIILLVVMASGLFLVWGYYEGILVYIYEGIGPHFALVFCVFLVLGAFLGIQEAWRLSHDINTIKNGDISVAQLKTLFAISEFSNVNIELLKEQISDRLTLRMDTIKYIADLGALTGLFGTAYGLVLAFHAISEVRSVEDVFGQMPQISSSLSISFLTTLVGIIVYVIIGQMYRCVRNASTELKNRVFRSLHEDLQKGSSNVA